MEDTTPKKEKTLIGRVIVGIGDLILISNPAANVEATGYVKNLGVGTIRLSHEKPMTYTGYDQRVSHLAWTSGDRVYNLDWFTQYEILKRFS